MLQAIAMIVYWSERSALSLKGISGWQGRMVATKSCGDRHNRSHRLLRCKRRAVQRYLLKAHGKEGFEAAERGGVTVLGDCVGLIEAQNIVGEAAHSREDAGVFS